MYALVNLGSADNPPMVTVRLKAKEAPVNPRRLPLSGYGAQIPSPYMVEFGPRWRRVYVANYGNSGTAYIGRPGAWLGVVAEIVND